MPQLLLPLVPDGAAPPEPVFQRHSPGRTVDVSPGDPPGLSACRRGPTILSHVHRPVDLPGQLPTKRHHPALRRISHQREAERQEVPRRGHCRLLSAASRTQGRLSEPVREAPSASPTAAPGPPVCRDVPGTGRLPDPPTARAPADEPLVEFHKPPPPASPPPASDQSQRSVQDAAAADGLGMACTRVMCDLPALEQNGLFRHFNHCFPSLPGLLSRDWMEADPELAGALYVDGHVRRRNRPIRAPLSS